MVLRFFVCALVARKQHLVNKLDGHGIRLFHSQAQPTGTVFFKQGRVGNTTFSGKDSLLMMELTVILAQH